MKQEGTSPAYLSRRLASQRPDLLAKVKSGELTPHAAAKDAGIVKPKVQIPKEPTGAARLIVKHFTREQIRELIALLQQAVDTPP